MLSRLSIGLLIFLLTLVACAPAAPVPAAPAPTPVPPTLTSAPTEAPLTPEEEKVEEGKEGEAAVEGQTITVDIEKFAFGDGELTITPGTTVVWENYDSAPHTVTADNGLFDSGRLGKGDEFSFTFTEEGEYPYYCRSHGGAGGQGMAGKVIVRK
jgi:plastocyanin